MRARSHAFLLLVLGAGAMHCGARTQARSAQPARTPAPEPHEDTALRAVAIAAGLRHVCALTSEGKVLCWGANASGQLGDGTRATRMHPTAVTALDGADQIVSGDEHTCARTSGNQALLCWGQNAHGELGDGTTEERLSPVPVSDLHAVSSASAGGHQTCARKTNRFVLCWGEVHEGGTVNQPTPVFGMTETEEVAVGAHHACARGAEGRVLCWGSNNLRQLGIPHVADRGMPVAVPHVESPVVQLALGHEHSCARTEQGAALCWGGGLRCVPGEWFEGKRVAVKPGAIPNMDDVSLVAAGGDQACAVRKDGSVVCAHEKGTSSARADRSCTAEPIAGLSAVSALALGDGFGCALKTDGTVWCWGKNDAGQLGDGTTRARTEPAQVMR